MIFTSCLEQEVSEPDFDQIEAVAEVPVEVDGFSAVTKSVVNETDSGIEMLWGTSESIGVYGTNLQNTRFTSKNQYKQEASVYFSGAKLFSSPKYAYYPYSEDNASNPMTAVRGDLPSTQYFSTIHKMMTTDYKIGVYASRSLLSYKFNFYHLMTFARFKVNADGTALSGDRLQRVSIEVTSSDGQPRQLNGGFTMDITKSSTEAITGWDSPEDDANMITLVFSDAPELSEGATISGYASAAPLVQVGDIIDFKIVTDKHTATFSRTSKVAFSANGLINYPLTLANFTDMVVETIPESIPDETPPDDPLAGLTDATPALNSFRFTVADNPGRILGRKFSHNSSFTVSTSTVIEEACTIDTENGKIILNLPYLNDRRLVPTFEIPEGTALVYEGGVIVSGETEVDFSQYRQVAVVNGNEEALLFDIEFTNTGLPVVVINQETGTTSSESNSEYSKASAAWYAATGTKWQPKSSDWEMTSGVDNFMIYNPDGTSALVDKNGAVVEAAIDASTRIRGNVTQQMPKKPFAVKLDKKHGFSITKADGSQVDFPAHKRWVLLANWKDRTLMRNAVAFGIADVFKNTLSGGIAWNPSGQFVELVYNGVHVGTYYLCEQIKIDGNRLDIKEPYDADDAFTSVGDYGYLLESDDGYDETWQFTTANYVPFLFKDDGNDAMLEYAAGFVRGIEDNLYAGNYTTAYANMDLTSFVDFWLIQELMMNSETGHPKSCYSYINDGKIYAGPIWDFDWNTLPVSNSYSENGYEFGKSMLEDAVPSSGWFGSKSYQCYHKSSGYPSAPLEESDANYLWYPMLVKDATFTALAAERWNAVKGAVQAYVDTQIPVLKAEVAVSEAVNNAMWPVDSKTSSWSSKRSSTYGIGGGFCGDEGKSFSDAVSTLQSTLTTRINGMSYVSDQNWPSVTYGSK